jgi:hypothetical protein
VEAAPYEYMARQTADRRHRGWVRIREQIESGETVADIAASWAKDEAASRSGEALSPY